MNGLPSTIENSSVIAFRKLSREKRGEDGKVSSILRFCQAATTTTQLLRDKDNNRSKKERKWMTYIYSEWNEGFHIVN